MCLLLKYTHTHPRTSPVWQHEVFLRVSQDQPPYCRAVVNVIIAQSQLVTYCFSVTFSPLYLLFYTFLFIQFLLKKFICVHGANYSNRLASQYYQFYGVLCLVCFIITGGFLLPSFLLQLYNSFTSSIFFFPAHFVHHFLDPLCLLLISILVIFPPFSIHFSVFLSFSFRVNSQSAYVHLSSCILLSPSFPVLPFSSRALHNQSIPFSSLILYFLNHCVCLLTSHYSLSQQFLIVLPTSLLQFHCLLSLLPFLPYLSLTFTLSSLSKYLFLLSTAYTLLRSTPQPPLCIEHP